MRLCPRVDGRGAGRESHGFEQDMLTHHTQLRDQRPESSSGARRTRHTNVDVAGTTSGLRVRLSRQFLRRYKREFEIGFLQVGIGPAGLHRINEKYLPAGCKLANVPACFWTSITCGARS